jgi:hypothetical protein
MSGNSSLGHREEIMKIGLIVFLLGLVMSAPVMAGLAALPDPSGIYDRHGKALRGEHTRGSNATIPDGSVLLAQQTEKPRNAVRIEDLSGRLIERKRKKGKQTVVRNSKGEIVEKRITRDGRTEVRDKQGRLIRIETKK